MLFLKGILKTILYQPLFNALIFLVWLIPGHNMGLAIIALTIIIRFILLPSSVKATRQQKKMKDLQPAIQELQEKYKGDKQKQAQMLMDFYKANKVNPLGSCLPLLVQLPILIILYYVFQAGLDSSRLSMLYGFVPRPDFINNVFLGIDLAKPDKWVLPVIAGLLQFVQSRQIMPPTKAKKGEEMQAMISKQMLYLMPVFTIFIAGRLPAALPIYWIVTSVFTIIQQWFVLREPAHEIKGKHIVVQAKETKIGKNKPKKTSFLDKLQTYKNTKRENKAKKNGVEVTVRKKGDK